MAFTAKDVKVLRERTGCGMMDCKKALTEANGDMDAAIDILREQGLAKAAKKASRIAAEGLGLVKINGNDAVVIEVNSETDFVAKNEEFKTLVNDIADIVLKEKPATVEDALALEVNGKTVNDLISEKVATIGEKLTLRRFEIVSKEDGQIFGTYSHMGGKIVGTSTFTIPNQELVENLYYYEI